MTDGTDARGADALTIVLIGGPMTVDDGSTLDSRQPIIGDPSSRVTRASLATSLHWWTTVMSLVSPILDSSNPDAFALVIGGRSVVEVRADGELRRTRLRSLVPGGSTTAAVLRCIDEPLPDGYEIVAQESFQQWREAEGYKQVQILFGCRMPHGSERWVFLDRGEYYLHLAASCLRPSLIVDTSWGEEMDEDGSEYEPIAGRFREFEKNRLAGDGVVVVMPHTHRTDVFLQKYVNWVAAGRPEDNSARWSPPLPTNWDPTAPPDPVRYSCPVPVHAQFRVTGYLRDGEWRDPADLEAARSLLQARYDLKIGIWDLVNNATLRRTLLEAVPPAEPPVTSIDVPSAAAQRAQREVARRMAERAREEEAGHSIAVLLQPLRDIGWTKLIPRCDLCLPLTDLVPLSTIRRAASWPNDESYPLVQLELTISKRHCAVNVFTIMYNQVDLRRYVHDRQKLLEDIAGPDKCDLAGSGVVSLYRRPGGWADDVDWSAVTSAIADRSSRWREAFEDLCQECRRLLDQWSIADRDSSALPEPRPSAAQVLQQAGPEGMRTALRSAGVSLDTLSTDQLLEVFVSVADGLARGQSVTSELCSKLMIVLEDWDTAVSVAWTAQVWAQSEQAINQYREDGVRFVKWLGAGGDCQQCEANSRIGRVPLGHPFPSGHRCPPAHARCRCCLAPSIGL
jgi:hypothetical protein